MAYELRPLANRAAERRGIGTDDVIGTSYEFATKRITFKRVDAPPIAFTLDADDYPPPCPTCGGPGKW